MESKTRIYIGVFFLVLLVGSVVGSFVFKSNVNATNGQENPELKKYRS